MTTARAERFVLSRLSSGHIVLLALLLDVDGRIPAAEGVAPTFAGPRPAVGDPRGSVPRPAESRSWADGFDAAGRAIYLVGAHAVRQLPDGDAAIRAVVAALASGEVPDGVVAVDYKPMAAGAWAQSVFGAGDEVLIDGPRGSGKTQVTPAIAAALAEEHARAGFPLPLRLLWLHTSLTNARDKTVASLEQSQWAGLWSFADDKQVALLTIGGVVMMKASFVGTRDEASQDRARAESHSTIAEEVVSSLEEGGGIEERKFDLAKSSARLPTRRRVAIAVTNPGAADHWLYRRFIEGGGRPGCVRCQIAAADRLSEEEIRRLERDYAGNPDMQARLARGEWSDLLLGEVVAAGYDPQIHVGATRLVPSASHMLAIGWDGGHSPSAVIAQLLDGQVRVYASLNDLKVGVAELIEDQVIPWLISHASWARQRRGLLTHVIDPSMKTAGQDSIRHSAERTIYEMLGGRIVYASAAWAPRREAILRVLAPRHIGGRAALAISPVPETTLLRQAFSSRWYYAQTPDGRVDRSRPKKPNSPFSDIGDAAAYVFGWLRPGSTAEDIKRPTQPIYARTSTGTGQGASGLRRTKYASGTTTRDQW